MMMKQDNNHHSNQLTDKLYNKNSVEQYKKINKSRKFTEDLIRNIQIYRRHET